MPAQYAMRNGTEEHRLLVSRASRQVDRGGGSKGWLPDLDLSVLVCHLLSFFFSSQRKGALAKGVSAGSGVTSKKSEHCQGYSAQQYFGHLEHHIQERRICLQKPPSKTPLFLVHDFWDFSDFPGFCL